MLMMIVTMTTTMIITMTTMATNDDQLNHYDLVTMMTISTTMIISTLMTISAVMTTVFVRILEVVHKQVGDYRTRCAPITASITQAINE